MPYLNEIVNIVNTSLATGKLQDDGRFIKQLHGLAETLPRNQATAQEGIPAIVDLNGGVNFSGFNDVYSIVIYHRCLSTAIQPAPFAFGDGGNIAREVANMRMIVFADRLRTKLQPQQLNFLLIAALQQQLTKQQVSAFPGLFGAILEVATTNYDGPAIWANEYKLPASSYPVQPHQMYMAVDYTITTDFDMTCISDCPTC